MIQPIGAVAGLVPGIGVQTLTAPVAVPGAATPDGVGFGASLTNAIEGVQAAQSRSSALAVKAVTGDLDDVHDYTIASAQAGVMFELTAAVRNKAVEAFTEIMRMQA